MGAVVNTSTDPEAIIRSARTGYLFRLLGGYGELDTRAMVEYDGVNDVLWRALLWGTEYYIESFGVDELSVLEDLRKVIILHLTEEMKRRGKWG